MFTGIIEELGQVRERFPAGACERFVIGAMTVLSDVSLGASIAVNGACLTVIEWGPDWWAAEAVPETLRCTNLGALVVGDRVNLERPLAAAAARASSAPAMRAVRWRNSSGLSLGLAPP